jgi:hypothetical protein
MQVKRNPSCHLLTAAANTVWLLNNTENKFSPDTDINKEINNDDYVHMNFESD